MQEQFGGVTGASEQKKAQEAAEKPEAGCVFDLGEDFKDLLEEANTAVTHDAMTEEDIDNMLMDRQVSLDLVRDAVLNHEEQLRSAVRENPFAMMQPTDYARLVEEGVLSENAAKQLEGAQGTLERFEAVEHPNERTVANINKLQEKLEAKHAELQSIIGQHSRAFEAEQQAARNEIVTAYEERIAALEAIIQEVEGNPKALDTLHERALVEYNAFKERIATEDKWLLDGAARAIKSLRARHDNAFSRIAKLLSRGDVQVVLRDAVYEIDRDSEKEIFDGVRTELINAVLSGEGDGQLSAPEEIVPWKKRTNSGIQYGSAMRPLQERATVDALERAAEAGDERAKQLLTQRRAVIEENVLLKKLVGDEWVKSSRNKGGKQHSVRTKGPFWNAFDNRKKNDDSGATEARRKAREEAAARAERDEAVLNDIVTRGGKRMTVPQYQILPGGRTRLTGNAIGAVLLEEDVSQKGKEILRVVGLAGAAEGAIKVGQASPRDMSAFPKWLKAAYPEYAVRQEGGGKKKKSKGDRAERDREERAKMKGRQGKKN